MILWGRKWGQKGRIRALQPSAWKSWEQRWIPQTSTELLELEPLRSCLRMLDALEDLDDVRSVTSNLEADEELLNAVLG